MRGSSVAERNELERRVRDLENKLARTRFIAGTAGGGSNLVYAVAMSGSLTGTAFSMAYSDLIQASIHLVLRGRTLKPGVDFTISGAILTMGFAPFEAGDPGSVQSFNNFFIRQAERS